jgi:protocatechuate 3,4-dioxygenase beta subunit
VAASFVVPRAFAEEIYTSQMVEGPLYPDKFPLDTDNDLLIVNDQINRGVGEIVYLSGHVYSRSGLPVAGATIEIWQTDAHGNYIHSEGALSSTPRDSNFQGYGRFLTDANGRYFFRTIKPVPYSQLGLTRAPHIHFAISKFGKRIFTSQMMTNGHELNPTDGMLQAIRDPLAQETLMIDYVPVPGSGIGEHTATFDIYLGLTVEEYDDGSKRGLGAQLSSQHALQPPDWGEF